MPSRALLTRIERLERAMKAKTMYGPDCICFPTDEIPFFGLAIMEEMAARLECPIHGKRKFWRLTPLFVPAWRREQEPKRLPFRSPQYQKAWNATFRPALWPAEEEETADGRIILKLKDGTRLLSCTDHE
jgi:hypothetical protein